MNTLTISPPATLKRILNLGAIAYFLYGLFLLIESLDFLDMLHTKPPDYSPTYTLVNVIYYIMDMIICISLGFACILLAAQQKVSRILLLISLIFIFRASTIYYLYFFTTPHKWIPYIHKVANEFSHAARTFFLPVQLILGFSGIWSAAKGVMKGNRAAKQAGLS